MCRDGEKVSNLMQQLNHNGIYVLDEISKKFLVDFYGNYATKDEIFKDINRLYHEEKYLMDTHTAVAHTVLRKYKKESKDYKQSLIIATASPYKFPKVVLEGLENDKTELSVNRDDFAAVKSLEKLNNNLSKL